MNALNILIIDDEPDMGDILAVRLKRHNMHPHAVCSGKIGLTYLASHSVDVVLLDVKMPEMDGLTVLRHIAASYPQVVVIMISGHADMDSAAQGLALGAAHYLLKPIDFEMLLHQIEDAYRQKQIASTELA